MVDVLVCPWLCRRRRICCRMDNFVVFHISTKGDSLLPYMLTGYRSTTHSRLFSSSTLRFHKLKAPPTYTKHISSLFSEHMRPKLTLHLHVRKLACTHFYGNVSECYGIRLPLLWDKHLPMPQIPQEGNSKRRLLTRNNPTV